MSAQSLSSESLLSERAFRGLFESDKEVRQFFAACTGFSDVSTSVENFSLQSSGSPKLVWHSSGFLSGEPWKLTEASAKSRTNNPSMPVLTFGRSSQKTAYFYLRNKIRGRSIFRNYLVKI